MAAPEGKWKPIGVDLDDDSQSASRTCGLNVSCGGGGDDDDARRDVGTTIDRACDCGEPT